MTELTTRLSLPKPDSDNSEIPAGPAQVGALADALDIAAIYGQGILSSRPVSTAGSPGITGRYYFVLGDSTTANNGVLWLDYGTGWVQVNAPGTVIDMLANRPAASAVPSGTRFFASDQVAEYLSDGTAWQRLGDQPGETSVCLTAAAADGHILLQGQAWPSTTGIYADLYAKFGGSNLPDLRGVSPVGYKAADADFGTLLHTGGEKKHTLTVAELPAVEVDNTNAGGAAGRLAPATGLSHNNLQPFIVVNFQAKL